MKIAFIGFGEAARAFTDSLRAANAAQVTAAHDRLDASDMAAAMAERGVTRAASAAEAVTGADWIFSAVTADQSLEAVRAAAAGIRPGQIVIDINSVSPARKRETASLVEAAGADYLDMAVMAPVHPRGHATPVLLAGRRATELISAFEALGFAPSHAGDEAGAATAIKMVRSLFVKGLEAITVETCLAAAASGCLDRVVSSLDQSFPGLDLPRSAAYFFERSLRHGNRRAAEMRESAATLDALDLRGALAAEIAAVHEAMGALPIADLPEGDFAAAVAEVARLRRDRAGG